MSNGNDFEYYVIIKNFQGNEYIMDSFFDKAPQPREILESLLIEGINPREIKSWEVLSVSEELGHFMSKDTSPEDSRYRIMWTPGRSNRILRSQFMVPSQGD